jgi:hypothetical protein
MSGTKTRPYPRTLRFRPVRPGPPARDAIPGPRPGVPFRPVRPGLSAAIATRRPVARDPRARVRIRIELGTCAAANTAPAAPANQPSHRHETHLAYHPSHGGTLLRTALAGRRHSGTRDLALHARLMELALQAGNAEAPRMREGRKCENDGHAQGPKTQTRRRRFAP